MFVCITWYLCIWRMLALLPRYSPQKTISGFIICMAFILRIVIGKTTSMYLGRYLCRVRIHFTVSGSLTTLCGLSKYPYFGISRRIVELLKVLSWAMFDKCLHWPPFTYMAFICFWPLYGLQNSLWVCFGLLRVVSWDTPASSSLIWKKKPVTYLQNYL